ncbi:DUF6122 family protein [Kaistella montana]|uniref:DUF6122 family protein n=1 Tax=Kaistella montana TaxID=1849733 RepID=A0ABW5K962_9FLAO|nr:DUF6122 family protein [Kaistella montana]MCQ4035777.1 DUF6122 family protein [Kaistella montana]
MENLFYIREFVHYFFHFVFPLLVAKVFFQNNWQKAYLLMLATMLVDLDHLFAHPIFDPDRSSVGFHPLHSYPIVALYFLGFIFLKGNYRIIALGLVIHMITDFQDFYLWKLIYR